MRWICLAALILAGQAGCGGASRRGAGLESTVVQLESSAQRDRRKMRNLENELVVLRDKLRATRQRGAAMPALPVEILEPEPSESAETAEPDDFDDLDDGGDAYQVVGVDEEGLEIIYTGEAAEDRSVRPRRLPDMTGPPPSAAPYEPPRSGASLRDTSLSGSRQAPYIPVHRDEGDPSMDRLAVTDDVGPTVQQQLREAPRLARASARPDSIPSAPLPAPAARSAAPNPPASSTLNPGDPRAQYKRYYDALRAGNHAYAIAGFRNFVERFPDHDHADNARYWLGEAFYDQREYRIALAEFRKVVTDHAGGNKVPDAMLKIGYCHIALGDMTEARAALQRVIDQFPRSQPARLAAERLASLDKD